MRRPTDACSVRRDVRIHQVCFSQNSDVGRLVSSPLEPRPFSGVARRALFASRCLPCQRRMRARSRLSSQSHERLRAQTNVRRGRRTEARSRTTRSGRRPSLPETNSMSGRVCVRNKGLFPRSRASNVTKHANDKEEEHLHKRARLGGLVVETPSKKNTCQSSCCARNFSGSQPCVGCPFSFSSPGVGMWNNPQGPATQKSTTKSQSPGYKHHKREEDPSSRLSQWAATHRETGQSKNSVEQSSHTRKQKA